MDKIYDLKIFKEQLEDYIHINYKLVFARHITGGRHYWWILDGKIYKF